MMRVLICFLTAFVICARGGILGRCFKRKLFEENPENFQHQRIANVLKIKEKLYVMWQNFPPSHPTVCQSIQFDRKINATHCLFTLAAFDVKKNTYNHKFRTKVKSWKTGKHSECNALTYQYGSGPVSKVQKLMYMSPNGICMIFVEDRKSPKQARCQLMMIASNVGKGVPQVCQEVFDKNCPGPRVKMYKQMCKKLTTVHLESVSNPDDPLIE